MNNGFLSPLAFILLVQVLGLIYLVYACRRIARNQVDLAEYLKERLEKKD
jgi:hypothetical protein